jgi:hypothetical protein
MNTVININKKEPDIISFMGLRQGIGWLGIALPFVLAIVELALFHQGIQDSISYYYHKEVRDILVGILFATGIFLWAYKGYTMKDLIFNRIAAVAAVGIALFPTPEDLSYKGLTVHAVCATVFFVTLTIISGFLFTQTTPGRDKTPAKKVRDVVYRGCAIVMFIAIVMITAWSMLTLPFNIPNHTFWLETVALVAFGLSWLTKGQVIFKDDTAKIMVPANNSTIANRGVSYAADVTQPKLAKRAKRKSSR